MIVTSAPVSIRTLPSSEGGRTPTVPGLLPGRKCDSPRVIMHPDKGRLSTLRANQWAPKWELVQTATTLADVRPCVLYFGRGTGLFQETGRQRERLPCWHRISQRACLQLSLPTCPNASPPSPPGLTRRERCGPVGFSRVCGCPCCPPPRLPSLFDDIAKSASCAGRLTRPARPALRRLSAARRLGRA